VVLLADTQAEREELEMVLVVAAEEAAGVPLESALPGEMPMPWVHRLLPIRAREGAEVDATPRLAEPVVLDIA
jgi:hypothetical protein